MTRSGELTCSASMTSSVTIGGVSKTLAAGKTLKAGEHGSFRCQDINPHFKGFVWLICDGHMIVPDITHCFNTQSVNDACKQQLYYLEITYVKAYVELTRLVVEYEKLVNSTACMDEVKEECEEKELPYYTKLNKLTITLTEMTTKVVE